MKYKFVGEGPGVPGLPHEITDDEAAALGLTDLLKAAVANGNYQAIDRAERGNDDRAERSGEAAQSKRKGA